MINPFYFDQEFLQLVNEIN